MIPRKIKFLLWNAPGRAAYLRCLDKLSEIFRGSPVLRTIPSPRAVPSQETVFSEGTLVDESRDIAVGYELFHPRTLTGRLPAIVLSTGMHFSAAWPAPRTLYLAEHFASHGYIVMHLSHEGSDAAFLSEASDEKADLLRAVRGVYDTWVDEPDRIFDVIFAIDTLEAWEQGGSPLTGHIDMERIGVSGYCFGGRTALAAMGEMIGPSRRSFKDGRIRAGIVYSVGQGWPPGRSREVFSDVDVPILHMSGTRDRAYADPGIPEDKMGAYEGISAPHQYALVLKRADHMVFSGERPGGVEFPTDARHRRLIKNAALAFWDAYLKEDAEARRWLDEEFAQILGREGRFERK